MDASLATQNNGTPALAAYSLNKPEELSGLATLLAHHIENKGLFTNIQGKKHVNVEGWQFAGAMLGIVPIVEKVEDVSTGTQYTFKGYQGKPDTNVAHTEFRATVGLLDLRSGKTIGRGVASCSNIESKKRTFDPYAVESMAQTRATGKAFRLLLAWIVQAGGYATTPAEEMPDADAGTSAAVVVERAPIMRAVTNTAPADNAETAPVVWANADQVTEIKRLLDHPLVTRQERSKMLENINKLDEERATQAIAKLTRAIADREGTTAVAN